MSDPEKAPHLWERFRAWVFVRFGVSGLLFLTCATATVFAWTQWDKVSNWPGIHTIVELLSRESVPKADPERFSVLVAKLNGDATDTLGNQIFEVLKEFPGVQTLPLDRTLASDGRMTEDEEIAAGEKARQYLQQSDASVLIWGSVLDREHKIAKLFLTTSSAATQKGGQYQPEIDTTIRLPDVFWSDLAQVLRLVIASRYAEFRAKDGHYIADRLPSFMAGVRRLLNESRDGPGWDADARASTLVMGDALQTFGEQTGQEIPLQEAVEAYRTALREWARERLPLQWAGTQNNLGGVLTRLGERESGTQRLKGAADAYRAAMQEYTRERVPLRWATTQNNLGGALTRLGERESGTQRLEEAVEAYRAALEERTRERVPLQWAMIQNNLGGVLTRLGEQESGTRRLEEAVEAGGAAGIYPRAGAASVGDDAE
jgi:Tetratricopeptide repeat